MIVIDENIPDSQRLLSERYPESDFTLNVVRRCKEKFGLLNIPRKRAEVEIPVHGQCAGLGGGLLPLLCVDLKPHFLQKTCGRL